MMKTKNTSISLVILLNFNEMFFNISKRAKNLKFNGEECVTKCVVQLLLIGITKDIIDRFLSQFSDEVHKLEK